jgi:hypothetical protein
LATATDWQLCQFVTLRDVHPCNLLLSRAEPNPALDGRSIAKAMLPLVIE